MPIRTENKGRVLKNRNINYTVSNISRVTTEIAEKATVKGGEIGIIECLVQCHSKIRKITILFLFICDLIFGNIFP